MSRDISPPPSSDDSAVGSMSSSNRTNNQSNILGTNLNTYSRVGQGSTPQVHQAASTDHQQGEPSNEQNNRPKTYVVPSELSMASRQMRYINTTLLSRSIRTNFSCFDDLDVQRLNYHTDYMVNFISIGINKNVHSIHRPVSILWPDNYDKMIDEVAKLDATLINVEFKQCPVEWMLANKLTTRPNCNFCKNPMNLTYEGKTVSWRCFKSDPCQTLYAPIQRPIFFKGYENVDLNKLIFAIYFWSTCTQCDLLYHHLRLEPETLSSIYQSMQDVCRISLEKSYPRYRLCNNPASDENKDNTQIKDSTELIDLISIKLNNCFVICAKHPRSNCVRLGLVIPKVSKYSFVELTETWFAHGAHIRICENKFMGLKSKRTDLTVVLAPRTEMITKDGLFHRESAFGYTLCQLSHIFKDFDSSKVPQETLKLILAELEWRELYGTNPYDAFTKIVEHMAAHKGTSHFYYEVPATGKCDIYQELAIRDESECVFAEKYFYANMTPLDADGKPIQRYGTKLDYCEYPISIVQFPCHLCSGIRYESFHLTMHLTAHAEYSRREHEESEFRKSKLHKCKHCFVKFKTEDMIEHGKLFRTDLSIMKFSCRICCIKFKDRSMYLDHMRRTHFEHEMPYRCPSCNYGSSFQRETIIHFQEEHQQEYVILCTFCLRSFTVPNPEKLDAAKLNRISQAVYNHILQHYALDDSFSCDRCCLSFLNSSELHKHKSRHHNPMEIFSERKVRVSPFIVTAEEEEFCVQALPMELFIPNKQPNAAIDEFTQASASSSTLIQNEQDKRGKTTQKLVRNGSSPNTDESSDDDFSVDEDRRHDNTEGDMIHVGPSTNPRRFLDGGEANLRVLKAKHTFKEWPTEKIIAALSKMDRADTIIPNQSVILTPDGRPARCIECHEFITTDHYVAGIPCKPCYYLTHCPRAATRHKKTMHTTRVERNGD